MEKGREKKNTKQSECALMHMCDCPTNNNSSNLCIYPLISYFSSVCVSQAFCCTLSNSPLPLPPCQTTSQKLKVWRTWKWGHLTKLSSFPIVSSQATVKLMLRFLLVVWFIVKYWEIIIWVSFFFFFETLLLWRCGTIGKEIWWNQSIKKFGRRKNTKNRPKWKLNENSWNGDLRFTSNFVSCCPSLAFSLWMKFLIQNYLFFFVF